MVTNGLRAQYWRGLAHSIINPSYQTAIDNYKTQTDSFIQKIQATQQSAVYSSDFMDEINGRVLSEIQSTNDMQLEFQEVFNSIKTWAISYFQASFKNNEDRFNELKKAYNDALEKRIKQNNGGEITQDQLKKIYDSLKYRIGNYISDTMFNKVGLIELIGGSNYGWIDANNTDIQNNLFGYARKIIFELIKSNVTKENIGDINYNIQHFIQSLKGYYKENLLGPVFNKALEKYHMGARQSGSVRYKGKQIKYDIIIGDKGISAKSDTEIESMLNNYLEIDNINASAEQSVSVYNPADNNLNFFGGIQSKSWVVPWSETPGNNWNISFGYDSNSVPDGDGHYYWHAGVYFAMKNIINIIGQRNFIFSTGDKVYWTYQLLSDFNNRNFVLAHQYSGKGKEKLGAGVSMQHHTC